LGYLEELFNRVESSGFTSASEIKDWLAGNRNKSSYTNISNILSEPFGIRELIGKATTYDEIKEIQNNLGSMQVKDSTTINEANDLIQEANLSREVERKVSSASALKSLEKLRADTNKISFRREIINSELENKITQVQREQKPTTFYISQIKVSTSESDIDRILEEASVDLGEGKNLDTISDIADIKKGLL